MRPEDIGIVIYFAALVATFIALVAVTVANITARQRSREDYRVIVVEKCYNCGYTRERGFRTDDYVGKETGTCPNCNAPLYVDAIFEIKVPRSRKKQPRRTEKNKSPGKQ